MLKNNYDIIFLALPRWDSKYSSTSLSLAKELAKNNRVFYIDNPFTIVDFFRLFRSKYIQRRLKSLIWGRDKIHKPYSHLNFYAITPHPIIPINFLPAGFVYKLLAKINDKILFMSISDCLEKMKIHEFIFINSFNPLYGKYFPANFKPQVKIYQTVDDISQSLYINKHGSRLEEYHIKNSDITLTTSIELKNLKKHLSKSVNYLPNAADFSIFNSVVEGNYNKPNEIAFLNYEKIVTYTGHVDLRVDHELLLAIANYYPKYLILLIGPVSPHDSKLPELQKTKNILFAGKKNLATLPSYLQYTDCTIIPFKKTKLTKSIYPLKINEYLAAGLPVVSTEFSEDIASFHNVAYIAKNQEEFIHAIDYCISNDSTHSQKERIKVAKENTWEKRINQFWEILDLNINSNE